MIGQSELILILLVVVLLFGASAIPRLARSLGKAKAEFEQGVREGREERRGDGPAPTKRTKRRKKPAPRHRR